MRPSKSLRHLLVGLVGLSGVSLSPALAPASQEFPGALQEAAGMPCVPDCVVCHGVSPGTADTWSRKKLGLALNFGLPSTLPKNTASLKAAFAVYKANVANAPAIAALQQGLDPEGGADICTPSYGCGATIARKPARRWPDPAGTVAGALAVLAGLLVMRRRRR